MQVRGERFGDQGAEAMSAQIHESEFGTLDSDSCLKIFRQRSANGNAAKAQKEAQEDQGAGSQCSRRDGLPLK
ncbi:MAG: hypothetical protein ACXWR1_20080, partial [Bdellovibrionota bacterium]